GQQVGVADLPRIVNFPTKDLLAPEDVKFSRQNALKLPCDAVGSNLQWTWKHNGTAITTGGKFAIGVDGTLYGSYLESAQSGNYQCFVRDNVTGIETFSRKIQVAVTVVGTFSNQNEQEVLVDLGEEFSYNCPQHSSSYGVSYSWQGKINAMHIRFKRNDRRAISQTGQLLIMYVTQQDIDDFAEYDSQGIRCFMTGANRFEYSGILKLKKKTAGQTDPGIPRAPAWKLIPAAIETAVEGRNKTLYCLAVGRPVPMITWKMQDKSGNWRNLVHGQDSFEIATAFQGRLLNIISVKKSMHETNYRCEAENSQSGGNPLVHDIRLDVEVAPRFLAAPPQQLEIDVNGNGSLTCDVFADPSPSFKWYKNGQQLTTSTVQVILNGNKLVFKNVRYPNEIGVYQCVAENQHGMIVSSTYVKVLGIKTSFAESGFGPFYLFKGTEGRLKCNPKAAPRPPKDQYKWYKGTTLLTSSPPYKIEYGEYSTLIIDNVDKNRDEGDYKCFAANFLGQDEATGKATVLERTIITVRPENKQVDEGTRVDLKCEATADPSLELRYYWKRDSAVITYNSKIQWLEVPKVLTIASITVDDAGNYTCVAYTPDPKRSEDQASATIDISG
ncbi:unnamed protein product, partial [Porites lobata]